MATPKGAGGRHRRLCGRLSALLGLSLSAFALPALADTDPQAPAGQPAIELDAIAGAEAAYTAAFKHFEAGNYDAARYLAAAAAEVGHIDAALMTATLAEKGLGGEQDDDTAATLYRAVMEEREDPDALLGLGRLGRESRGGVTPEEAVDALRTAGSLGKVEARHELARLYLLGAPGVPANSTTARALFYEAAVGGVVPAKRELGLVMLEGRGGPIEPNEGVRWLTEAASDGDVEAAYEAALVLSDGTLVAPRDAQAARLFRQAADEGHARSATLLGLMTKLGQGVEPDQNGALALWNQAAETGDALAGFYLAVAYAKGEGVTQDFNQSLAWAEASKVAGQLEDPNESQARDQLIALLRQELGREEPRGAAALRR